MSWAIEIVREPMTQLSYFDHEFKYHKITLQGLDSNLGPKSISQDTRFFFGGGGGGDYCIVGAWALIPVVKPTVIG